MIVGLVVLALLLALFRAYPRQSAPAGGAAGHLLVHARRQHAGRDERRRGRDAPRLTSGRAPSGGQPPAARPAAAAARRAMVRRGFAAALFTAAAAQPRRRRRPTAARSLACALGRDRLAAIARGRGARRRRAGRGQSVKRAVSTTSFDRYFQVRPVAVARMAMAPRIWPAVSWLQS